MTEENLKELCFFKTNRNSIQNYKRNTTSQNLHPIFLLLATEQISHQGGYFFGPWPARQWEISQGVTVFLHIRHHHQLLFMKYFPDSVNAALAIQVPTYQSNHGVLKETHISQKEALTKSLVLETLPFPHRSSQKLCFEYFCFWLRWSNRGWIYPVSWKEV